jgi:hypothetical protein
MAAKKPRHLTGRQVERAVFRRCAAYDRLSYLEQFATFMGKTQLLELRLKGLLAQKYDYNLDEIEKWTLGRVVRELKSNGLRGDFVALLESLVKWRNLIAHELLAQDALFRSLMGRRVRTPRFLIRPLLHGIFELEQIIYLHDWVEKHKGWD